MRYKVTHPSGETFDTEGTVVLKLSFREFDVLSTLVSGSTSSVGVSGFWENFRDAAAQRWQTPPAMFAEPNASSRGRLRDFICEQRHWRVDEYYAGPASSVRGLRISRGRSGGA